MSKNNERFKNALVKVASDPKVQNNPKLLALFKQAITKADRNESVQNIGFHLARQIKSSFSEAQLPQSVINLQLRLEKFAAVGGDGMVAFFNKFF